MGRAKPADIFYSLPANPNLPSIKTSSSSGIGKSWLRTLEQSATCVSTMKLCPRSTSLRFVIVLIIIHLVSFSTSSDPSEELDARALGDIKTQDDTENVSNMRREDGDDDDNIEDEDSKERKTRVKRCMYNELS